MLASFHCHLVSKEIAASVPFTIQHNTQIADGLSGLGAALGAMAEAGIEMKYDQIHMSK